MCWESFKFPNKIIAEGNIPIFKVCRYWSSDIVMSYYKYMLYNLGETYELNGGIHVKNSVFFHIDEGFHSYTDGLLLRALCPKHIVVSCRDVNLAFYEGDHNVKVKGYIPEGATYYMNSWGECVSDKICLTEIEESYI